MPHVGATKAVDALRVVAHDGEVAVLARQKLHQICLDVVHVLILVHEHVREAAGDGAPDVWLARQKLGREAEQVVVVREPVAALGRVEGVAQVRDGIGVAGVVRVLLGDDLLHTHPAVGRAGEDALQRAFLGKAPLAGVQAFFGAHQINHVGGIGLIENREPVGQANRLAVLAQDFDAEGVERAAAHPLAAPVQQAAGADEHLARGASGKREQRDPVGLHARFHQIGHAVDQRARLACARRLLR